VVITGAGLVVLVLVQGTLVAFVPTPWAVPDLVIVTVLATAVALGPSRGAVAGGLVGLAAGVLLDLVGPAAGPLGAWALVLALAGLVLGRVAHAARPGPFAAMVLVALGAGAVVLARAGVLWFAGVPLRWSVAGIAVASIGYALVLAPLALLALTPRSPGRTAPIRTVPAELTAPAAPAAGPRAGVDGWQRP
jgi:hypothetical protein